MTERMSDDEVRLLGCADISDASVALATHNRMLAEIRRARESERRLAKILYRFAGTTALALRDPYEEAPDRAMFQEVNEALAAAGVT